MPARWSRFSLCIVFAVFSAALAARPLPFTHGDRWFELNIGPFHIDTQGDIGQARDELTQMEQLRWVLGGLLETQDLESTWPIRVVFTKEQVAAKFGFERQNGEYLLVCGPGAHVPLGQLAGILLDANTPRLPAEVESGLRELFSTLQAHGSRVTWGGAPAHPDLAWARMQLFATSFDYSASFHIFLASLRSGSSIRDAEINAFAKPQPELEREAQANLAGHNWEPVPVSGRPLDPKRDFGEQPLPTVIADVYIADAKLPDEPNLAQDAFKSAIDAGGEAAALGFEGLAQLARLQKRDPLPYLKEAAFAGTKSAPIYVALAKEADTDKALQLLKKAADLNPRWAKPLYFQAKLTADLHEREELLKQAVRLDPRTTAYWIELARTQSASGESTAAEGSWLRAEQSAPTQTEAARIHHLAAASEKQRLDAEEAAARQEREAAEAADEQAQDTEMARIQGAEKAANGTVTAETGSAAPEKAIPWSEAFPRKRLTGTLVTVECLQTQSRLSVKRRNGEITHLLLRGESRHSLACGPQRPARRISLVYAAQPHAPLASAGTVVSFELH